MWENPNKRTQFSAQTISLDLSKYKRVKIVCTFNNEDTVNEHVFVNELFVNSKYAQVCVAKQKLSGNWGVRETTVKTNGIVFGGGYLNDSNHNKICVPYEIYGLMY